VDGSDSSSVTMLNVVARRPSNVAPEDYLYNSIVNPSVHENLPDAYTEVLDGALIEDLVAYLMTLQDAEALDTALGEPAQTSDAGGDTGALAEQIQAADASLGETLFTTTNDTGFACSTCHLVDSTEQLVGPGLLGIPSHADDRVEGQNRYEYLYNSIIHPNEYVVEGFNEGLMPQGYDELYANEQEVYALVAYLLTLEEE
jgi:mono/diheme cytochrome c family protein